MKRLLIGTLVCFAVAGLCLAPSAESRQITPNGMSQGDEVTFLTNVMTLVNSLQTNFNNTQNALYNRTLTNPAVASNGVTLQVSTFTYLVGGNFCSQASAALTVTASVQATSTHRIYLFGLAANGTATCTAGTAVATYANMLMPAIASSVYTPFGYLYIKSGNVGTFTLGTSPFGVASLANFYSVSYLASSTGGGVAAVATTPLSLDNF